MPAKGKGAAAQCYMCESLETSHEHAPPRCIFPEAKDTQGGRDLRRNLITVPACADHNMRKSKDDEYLLHVLVACHPINEVGHQQARMKLSRAMNHSMSIMNRLMKGSEPALIEDELGIVETVAMPWDTARMDRMLDMLGRALFYHHYGRRWSDRIMVRPEFVSYGTNDQARRQLSSVYDVLLSSVVGNGDNPDVFRYWILQKDQSHFMRLAFYEHAKVTLLFHP